MGRAAQLRAVVAPLAVRPYRLHFAARMLSWTGSAVGSIGLAFAVLYIGGGATGRAHRGPAGRTGRGVRAHPEVRRTHGLPGALLELATACRRGERVRPAYRDRLDRATVRDVDPHRLVRTGHRWYLVALDVARGQWRTFRADRVTEARPTGRLTDLADPPDAALLVSRMLTSGYPLHTTVRVALPLDQALHLIPRNLGVHASDGAHATLVTIGGSTPEELATYLLRLATPPRVPDP
ncbi:WYL domain-containing protein [Streptomyces sp. NBC_01508]|uniref:WYL domain-containing protein n=1 Tax=Streptomyces sp. NBC_01508 TaxID=2903888 RepID=UPI003870D1C9